MKKEKSLYKNKIILLDIDYTIFDTSLFKKTNLEKYELYEEVYDTLQKLSNLAKLGVFSEGELAFQKRKLEKTKIEHFFHNEHIHIVLKKDDVIKEILSKYSKKEKVIIVDDRLLILYEIKKRIPVIYTIWMKRGAYAMNQTPIEAFNPDATVENLQEIIPLIKKV